MIAKTFSTTSVQNTHAYISNPSKGYWLGSNLMFDTKDSKRVAAEFNEIRNDKMTGKEGLHIVLAFSPDDKIKSGSEEDILESFIKEYGIEDHQWVAFEHTDKAHYHIHILANKINSIDRSRFHQPQHMELKRICRKLEKEYGLRSISNTKTINNSRRQELRNILEGVIPRCNDMKTLEGELSKVGIKMITGRGVVFVDKRTGAKLKGSSIGRSYSLQNLKKRLGGENSIPKSERRYSYEVENSRQSSKDQTETLITSRDMSGLLSGGLIGGSGNDPLEESMVKKKKKKRPIRDQGMSR